MKIVSLNAWGGRLSDIKQFILDQSIDTDIFCFQESWNDKNEIFCQDWLPDYQYFFDKKIVNQSHKFHQATFIKKNFQVVNTQTLGQEDIDIGLGLFTQIKFEDKNINVCNVHGRAYPGDKLDTPVRIRQSQLIIDFLKNLTGPKIIMGDFNLDFDSKSVHLFEENDYKNLIKEFKIPTTRNEISWEKYENKQLYADFAFVSKNINIKNFSVPNNEISDHLPMILEFDLK